MRGKKEEKAPPPRKRRTALEIYKDKGLPIWHGRKLKYSTAIMLEREIDKYFLSAPRQMVKSADGTKVEKPMYTLRGLILYCGLDEEEFNELAKKEKFRKVISRAKLVIGMSYEELLHTSNPAGAKFALENMGWTASKKEPSAVSINPFLQLIQNYGKKALPKNENIEDAEIIEMKDEEEG